MLLNIVIPIIKEDLFTFQKSYPFIKKYLPENKVTLIGPNIIEPYIKDMVNVEFLDENRLIQGMSLETIKKILKKRSGSYKRAGWYFQQFLKMAYAMVCKDEYYLIWDADTIPIAHIDFFEDTGKPYLDYRDYVKYDECFFETQNILFPNLYLKKVTKDSFICEHLLVNTRIMRELLDELAKKGTAGKDTFFENVMYIIPEHLLNLSGFSEFETYSSYVLKKYPDNYILRYWKNLRNGRTYIGDCLDENILKWISEKFDVISIEKFNSQWLICKLLISTSLYKKFKFSNIYSFINSIYSLTYDLRFKTRTLVGRTKDIINKMSGK